MKKSLLILLFFFSVFANAQTGKKIIITKAPKTVPAGKVWKLERNKGTIVQVSDGTLKSGTLCNAMFLSRPSLIFNINKGDYYNAEGYGIVFKDFEKVQYTNDITYSITPISIVDKNFSLSDLTSNSPENVGSKEIIFRAGETVFVGECLTSIELIEYNMTQAELQIEKKKILEIEKEKNKLKANFNIPINPEKYVEPGTKPTLKDSLLKEIVFSSNGVLHKQPGKRAGYDDATTWTMTLTIDNFELSSSSGINKSYKVLNIKYDDALKMQAYQLGDIEGTPTHTLNVSWSNSSKQYLVILMANDRSEEYQFQSTQATNKK